MDLFGYYLDIHLFTIANVRKFAFSNVERLPNFKLETKNQWARDDPAFVVIQAGFVAVCN